MLYGLGAALLESWGSRFHAQVRSNDTLLCACIKDTHKCMRIGAPAVFMDTWLQIVYHVSGSGWKKSFMMLGFLLVLYSRSHMSLAYSMSSPHQCSLYMWYTYATILPPLQLMALSGCSGGHTHGRHIWRELNPSSPVTCLQPVWHSAPHRPGSLPPRTQSKSLPKRILHS